MNILGGFFAFGRFKLISTISQMVNGDKDGIAMKGTMAVSCTVGDALYMSSTGYNKAKADAVATLPCVAICNETGTGEREIHTFGPIRNTAWNWTPASGFSGLLWVSDATAGLITQTPPVTVGKWRQCIGYVIDADTIFFYPNYAIVEI